jgi:hypothetical protein
METCPVVADERQADTHEDDKALAGELVEAGGDFAAAAVGGALGLIGGPVGVPAGAAGGVIATRMFRKVGAQMRRRWLDPREEVRVGGAFALAAAEVARRIEAGEALRSDGFFDASAGRDRSPGEEVLEGVLKAAADAHEERKVPYLANLYAEVAFRDDISLPYANALIRLATRCTWRQLVVLAFLDLDPPDFPAQRNRILDPGVAAVSEPCDAIWSDFDALGYDGVIGVKQEDRSVAHIAAVLGGGSFQAMDRSRIVPTTAGTDLIELMRLREVPEAELAAVSAALNRR